MSSRSVLLATCVAATWSVVAPAQSATVASDSNGAAPRDVDEIAVTTQKREQSLPKVPIVVTAVTAQQRQDAGVKDTKDLTVLTPGLLITSDHRAHPRRWYRRRQSGSRKLCRGRRRRRLPARNGVGFGDLGDCRASRS